MKSNNLHNEICVTVLF